MVMSSSSAAFFAENFAGTVSVFAGAPGTAKAPLTNTLFCAGDCWAAPGPTSDSAGGVTICALPDAVVATNANAAHAVPKCFTSPPPCLLDSSGACGSKISTPTILTEIARNHAASAYRGYFFGRGRPLYGLGQWNAFCPE